jgi:hypothetical protein
MLAAWRSHMNPDRCRRSSSEGCELDARDEGGTSMEERDEVTDGAEALRVARHRILSRPNETGISAQLNSRENG